jgi:2-dehydro-3-deoxyglucarate aldolase
MIGTFGLNTCADTTLCLTRGLDFFIIDREHGRASLTEAGNLLAAIATDCESFIRVSGCERVEIQKVLELKPEGILVPQIGSLQEARNAVDWSYFPPAGSRGVSPYTRGFDFIHHDLESKKQRLNDDLKLGLLIEGQSGFDALDDIIENLGTQLHLLYFGLFDFANSKQVEASWSNSEIFFALEQMVEKANKAGIAIGTIARSKDETRLLESAGVEYIVYLNDLGIFSEAISDL